MGWSENYNENEIVGDFTKVLSKIWDNLMPSVYPYVLKFETKSVVEVLQQKSMGPYTITENFLDYNCDVLIDNKPLIEEGWDGGKISVELWKRAYGESYFLDMQSKLVELSKYASFNFSQFDLGGKLNATTPDI